MQSSNILVVTVSTCLLWGSLLIDIIPKGILESPPSSPKNIILILANGLGLTHLSAGLYAQSQPLNVERMTASGLQLAYPLDGLATDPLAGTAAIWSGEKIPAGQKTYTNSQPSLATLASRNDRAVSWVTSGSNSEPFDIEKQGIDLYIGGEGEPWPDEYKVLRAKPSGKLELPPNGKRPIAYLTTQGLPPTAQAGRKYLPNACRKAAQWLLQRNPERGFLLVVQAAQIGYATQTEDILTLQQEVLDLDRTVGAALDFARTQGDVLVILAGTNETGGLAINPGSTPDSLITELTTTGHTGSLLPVFAYGPGAAVFHGVYENTAIYEKLVELWELN